MARRARGERRWRDRSGRRVFLLAVLLATASAWAFLDWLDHSGVNQVQVAMAERPLTLLGPSGRSALLEGEILPPASVVLTGEVQPAVLRYADASFRLTRGSKLRIVRAPRFWLRGIAVSLEKGRMWVRRGRSTPVVVLVPGSQVVPAAGDTEVVVEPGVGVRVVAWSAGVRVEPRDGGRSLELGRGEDADLSPEGEWSRVRIVDSIPDAWVTWNQETTNEQFRAGTAAPPPPPAPPQPSRRLAFPGKSRARPAEAGSTRLPPLPGPDYPKYRPERARKASRRFAARRLVKATPAPPRRQPDGAAALSPQASRGSFRIPEGLTTRGVPRLPRHAADLEALAHPVQRQSRGEQLMAHVERLLKRKFGMKLERPIRVVVAGRDDPDVRLEGRVSWVMHLETTPTRHLAKVASGVPEAEFAAWCASLYAEAWLSDQRLQPAEVLRKGFVRWISFKYSYEAGNMAQAYSISQQGGYSAVWSDPTYHRGFTRLWTIEERYGERGVFRVILGMPPAEDAA